LIQFFEQAGLTKRYHEYQYVVCAGVSI